jgi:uridylate kinase
MDQSAIALAKDESMPIYVCHIDRIEQIVTWVRDWTVVGK